MIRKMLWSLFLLYLLATGTSLFLTYAAVSRQRLEVIEEQYRQHFIAGEEIFQDYARNLSADLETLAANPSVRNRADQGFTSFLTADPETFRYAYTPEELEIIRLFQDYRNYHPDVNAIYMGRENGTFVRSHPRESATAYDPRVRPWYILGKGQPEWVQITYAYPSLTTQDVNIGFVRALVDESGAVYGVLGMDVTLKTLSERLASLPLTGGGWMEVADTQGRIIMAPGRNGWIPSWKRSRDTAPWRSSRAWRSPRGGKTTA